VAGSLTADEFRILQGRGGRVQHHSRDTIVEIERVKTSLDAERRWSLRRRILVIVGAAAVCWAIPAGIAYLLFLNH